MVPNPETKVGSLISVMLLEAGNHILWFAFTPIEYSVAEWMGGQYASDPSKIALYGTVTTPVSFLTGILAAYYFDAKGIYLPLMIGAWSTIPCCALRIGATYIASVDVRNTMFICSGLLCGLSLAMTSFAPTKVAAVWFNDKERVFANTLMAMMLEAGILFSYIVSPLK